MVKHKLLSVDYLNSNRFSQFVAGLALFLCFGLQSPVAANVISPDIQVLAEQFPPDSSDPTSRDGGGEFKNFDVIPTQSLAGAESNYDLSFRLKRGEYHKLDKGGFAFAFPDGFDLRQITLVTIDDNERKPRYLVARFSSTRHFLFVSLERLGDGDDDDDDDKHLNSETGITLHVELIKNTPQPGLYKIAGLAYNKKRKLVAGPTISNSFEITGVGITGIVLLPEGDQTLPVGGSISFSAWSVDQAGNVLDEVDASLALTDDSDPIGSLSGSLFTAESIGIGRVRALFGDFEAFSGLIRVVSEPGPVLSYVPGSLMPLAVFAGVETEFSFDLILEESFPEDLIIHQASFTIFGDSFSSTTALTSESGLLMPGMNRVSSLAVIVPQNQVGNSLGARTEIVYSPVSDPDSKLTFRSELDNVTVGVEPTPVVQIISVESIAFNSPRVNVGQSYRISCRVANLSETKATSITLQLSSDGSSSFNPDLVIPEIAAQDTLEVFFELVASAIPNQHEHFVVNIVNPGLTQLLPLDNTAFVIIELPADLELSYSLLGVSDGIVHPGSAFSLSVELANAGEASASDALFAIDTDSVDFGNEFDATGTLAVDDHQVFLFRALTFDTSAVISFILTDIPIDLNTGQRAQVQDTSFQFTITVRQMDGGLAVDFTRDRLNLIMPGRSKRMFSMDLVNQLEARTYSIVMNSMSVFLFSDGRPIDAASVFDQSATGFFKGGIELSQLETSGNRLDITSDFLVAPRSRTPRLNFMAVALKTDLRGITLEINLSDIEARYFDGPAAGELVPVTSSGDSRVRFDYVFKGPTLEQSVIIENNPFNPNEELLHFTYELPVVSDIEFRILTLTGEEVYSLDIPFSSAGASSVGENELSWDGRNDKGHTVLNGVYVAFIRIVETGESSLTKVAVVK